MNIILLQELARYNKLIDVIKSNLTSIKDALQGTIVFSFELEEALNFIKINKVPKVWMDNSYPSLKPLPAYMENLRQRVDFFKKWVLEGKPPVYWLSGLYFPQGFLTGILQNFARKYSIAIDKLKYDFEVLPANTDLGAGAEDGAYVNGFFLEGAKFDYTRMCLSESDPKVGRRNPRCCSWRARPCTSSLWRSKTRSGSTRTSKRKATTSARSTARATGEACCRPPATPRTSS